MKNLIIILAILTSSLAQAGFNAEMQVRSLPNKSEINTGFGYIFGDFPIYPTVNFGIYDNQKDYTLSVKANVQSKIAEYFGSLFTFGGGVESYKKQGFFETGISFGMINQEPNCLMLPQDAHLIGFEYHNQSCRLENIYEYCRGLCLIF